MSEKEPTIIRISKVDRTDYTMLSNAILQDKTMTYEARGMLCYLLSHPQDWDVRVKDLQQQCGKAKAYRILKDLIEHRYVQRVAIRNEQNQFVEWIYTASEERYPEKRDDANPSESEPLTDFPQLASPQLENGDTYKGISSTKEEFNKEKLIASPDGNAAGDKSEWLPMSLAMRWFDAIDAMLEFPDAPFFHDITRVNDYLNELVNNGTLTPDMDAEQVLAIVKRELIAPPDNWTLTPDQSKFMRFYHNVIEKAYQEDDTEFLRGLSLSTEYKSVFGNMNWNEAYDRYEESLPTTQQCDETEAYRLAQSALLTQVLPPSAAAQHVPTDAPKKERKPNPWYDVILETMNVPGYKNGYIQGVLLAKGKNGYAKYDLETPLTDSDQVRIFWAWYEVKCPGCDLVSPAAVQMWVMRWQGEGCPDVRVKAYDPRKDPNVMQPYVPPGGYSF